MTLLRISDLSIAFPGKDGPVEAVRGVNLEIGRGETLALVGESGSGKSITALSTVQLLPPSAQPKGSITYDGREMMNAPAKTLRDVRGNDISFIFQEPMTSLNPLHTIEKQIAESLALHQGIGKGEARPRILELLNKVGLRNAEERLGAYPHQLSGGQRQRVMIAMALANKPDLLIADEPTTALDVTIQAQILDLLAELQREEGLAMLFITHDLGIVRKVAQRVAVMKDGEIVETGPTAEVFDNPLHPYTQMLLAAEPKGRAEPLAHGAQPLLEATGMRVWFPIKTGFMRKVTGHVKAVTDIDFELRAGETLGVVGESGSGKTTLALAAMRLIASEGRIRFQGRDIHNLGKHQLRDLRRHMQIVFQDPYGSLSPRMSIEEIVSEGLGVHGLEDRAFTKRDAVARQLDEVGLDPAMMDRYPHEFSGGQRQRIAIARAMILKPKFVVLDEPTSALDMTVQTQIVELLRSLQKKYELGYLFISHDLKVVRALAHRLLVMRNGEVVEQGRASDVFDNPKTDYARALMAAAFEMKAVEGVSD
ncbi:ABC transporter ATP-binding protein [Rhodobacteraceae bacterium NNCM2]|nr:ABC transporter ATP-binding protein [Coraliihabitans acroporae]